MTDARFFDEPLVGRWDPDARLYIATGWTYGPAGPASALLAPGVQLAVDFANPQTVNTLTIEAALIGDPRALDPVTLAVVEALLGPAGP